ncbi:hypothetical protein [Bacteroides pyogenes]|uniref:hypothetical protein n=1 Tax=Bacteroides pyogenes TaxID=310300 RepID=UPI002A919404|nr:hypothetical protein [Bacteroides pyogenes]MDY5432614.1 hypothetical protein [Bacteroides pyogenes]
MIEQAALCMQASHSFRVERQFGTSEQAALCMQGSHVFRMERQFATSEQAALCMQAGPLRTMLKRPVRKLCKAERGVPAG